MIAQARIDSVLHRLRARARWRWVPILALAGAAAVLPWRAGLGWPVAGAMATATWILLGLATVPRRATPADAAAWLDRRCGGVAWRTWRGLPATDGFRELVECELPNPEATGLPSPWTRRMTLGVGLALVAATTPLPSGGGLTRPWERVAHPAVSADPTSPQEVGAQSQLQTIAGEPAAPAGGSAEVVPLPPASASSADPGSAVSPADDPAAQTLVVPPDASLPGPGTAVRSGGDSGEAPATGEAAAGRRAAEAGTGLTVPEVGALEPSTEFRPGSEASETEEAIVQTPAPMAPGPTQPAPDSRIAAASGSWYDDEEILLLKAIQARWAAKGDRDGRR